MTFKFKKNNNYNKTINKPSFWFPRSGLKECKLKDKKYQLQFNQHTTSQLPLLRVLI